MPASKERVILSAVLGAGALALAVDRLVLDEGITGPPTVEGKPIDSPPPPIVETLDTPSTSMTLGQRLRDLKQSENIRISEMEDAFNPEGRDDRLLPNASAEAMPEIERSLRESHRLIGVMADRSEADDQELNSYVAFVEVSQPAPAKPSTIRLRLNDQVSGFYVADLGPYWSKSDPVPYVVLERAGRTIRLSTTNGR